MMTTNRNNDQQQDSYWMSIDERRRRLSLLGRHLRTPHEFHILGAGVAGLGAALEILSLPLPNGQRHKVTIYEGSNRVGGRINTRRLGKPPEDGPDTRPYFERGAMRVPSSHEYTFKYAQEVGLLRRRFFNTDQSYDFKKGQEIYLPADVEKLAEDYKVLDPDAKQGPGPLFRKNVLEPEMRRLDQEHGGDRRAWVRKILEGRIDTPGLQRIDRWSVRNALEHYLRQTDPGQVDFIVDLSLTGLTDRAFLMSIRNLFTIPGQLYEFCKVDRGKIVGGMDLLIEGLREKIEAIAPDTIQRQRLVTGIDTDGENWTVHFQSGPSIGRGGDRRRHLLCTLPSSILRDRKDFRLRGFSDAKVKAIDGLSYAYSTKVAVHVKERFWESRFQGGRSLNDRLTRATYFPNHPSAGEAIPDREETHAPYDLYTQPARMSPEDEAALAAASSQPSQPGPWLLLSSYTFGENAKETGRRPPLDTVADLERVFGKFDHYRQESETWFWHDDPFAKGPFALPAPEVISQFLQDAQKPEGGVFFAGDHVSFAPGWIQGSLYSSLWNMERLLWSAVGGDAPAELAEDFAQPTL